MLTRRTLTRQRDDARASVERLVEQRDDARGERDAAVGNQRRLARQLSDVRDGVDAHRKEPAPAPVPAAAAWVVERQALRRALLLSERARRALDERARALQDANEHLCREAVDRAGNLTRTEAAR